MRRFLGIGALAGLAVLVFAQVRGSDLLNNLAKATNGATSLSSTFTVQKIGGTTSTFKVDLAKPNKARIDTPTELIVADGTTITTLDKGDNSYFKKPQTDTDLKALFARDEMSLLGAFFDPNYYANVVSAKTAGSKTFGGVNYDVIEASMDKSGNKTISFFVDPSDKLAKRGQIVMVDKTANAKDTVLILSKQFLLNNAAGADTFAFAAPAGAKEVSLEEMNAG